MCINVDVNYLKYSILIVDSYYIQLTILYNLPVFSLVIWRQTSGSSMPLSGNRYINRVDWVYLKILDLLKNWSNRRTKPNNLPTEDFLAKAQRM